ncbi:hypothetical protein F9288_08390 [Sphingomonas sp. CL5.1]|uniref:hypothetical protein n=1 Tax=Sphingomonas sp. CL5.1 TaxID=2653203 RepID=UPI0015825D21|nr:hypothetical protein [Sphingomonas sp. CL5.1]QKR99659.1 hypothetical protein F9288_08390 [Sphingomonas sp. CL5.1]
MLLLLTVVLVAVLILGAIWLFDLERRMSALEAARRGGVTADGKRFGRRRTDRL